MSTFFYPAPCFLSSMLNFYTVFCAKRTAFCDGIVAFITCAAPSECFTTAFYKKAEKNSQKGCFYSTLFGLISVCRTAGSEVI